METTFFNVQKGLSAENKMKVRDGNVIYNAMFYKVSESDQAYYITIDISHFRNPQLNIGVTGDKLLIQLEEFEPSFTIYQDRAYKSNHTVFFRMLDMPQNVDQEKMKAWVEEKVYYIMLPKESVQARLSYFF